MEVMQLLLIDGRLMAPYLITQDLRQLSQTRQAWRGVVGQIVTLHPRSAHMPASRRHELALRQAVDTWDKVRDARSGALPLHALRTQAARQDYQDAGWDPLLSALEQGKARHLQSLDITVQQRDFHWRPRLTCASTCRLAASLSYMPNLLHLILPGNTIGTGGARALADGLNHTPHLRTLHLAVSDIGDEGVQAIAGALHKVPELTCLDLGWRFMRYPAAKQLASSLKYVPRLKYLAFGRYCQDGIPILERLTDLPELVRLDMTRGLTSEVIELLGLQLRQLPKLSELFLGQTQLNESSLRDFATMVTSVPSLKYIKIMEGNPLRLTAQMCIDFKSALEDQGFQEIESVPGQMDAQRKAEDLEFDRRKRMLDMLGNYPGRILSLRRT